MKITLYKTGQGKRLLPILLASGFSLITISASAKTLYVQPTSEVPLRRGQGTDYKIMAIVSNGTPVFYMEEKEGWAKVRLKSGKEGWILKRYLSDSPPLTTQIAALKEEKQQLVTEVEDLQRKLGEVSEAHNRAAEELSTCIGERTDLRDKYQTLEQDTADVVQTKNALLNAENEIEALKTSYEEIKIANSVLKKNESIKWFLAGTGVLLAGWVLGRFSQRSKKRKPSLLS